jgi:protein-S-isoprenylcysteine O-methyltransferase Ste14
MNRSGGRGEGFLIVQAGLFLLLLCGPRTSSWLPLLPETPTWLNDVAVGMIMAGALFAAIAVVALGKKMTPLPAPKADAVLRVSGVYGAVRHPMYSGIILMSFGWSLWLRSPLVACYALLLLLFFDVKSRFEEKLLLATFPDYAAYQKKVRKLVPFLY